MIAAAMLSYCLQGMNEHRRIPKEGFLIYFDGQFGFFSSSDLMIDEAYRTGYKINDAG